MKSKNFEKTIEKQKSSEEELFKEEKTEFYRKISSYYKLDATTNNEIRERLSFFKLALDDFDFNTFNVIKKKILIDKNTKLDKLIMLQISFSVYYPSWIFFGAEKSFEMINKNEFPEIVITESRVKDGVYDDQIKKGNWKNYEFLNQKNPALLCNFIMHETIHALGYITRNSEKNTWNEFAVGLFLPFFLPISRKKSKVYSDFYFGFRNPFHISELKDKSFSLRPRGKLQISQDNVSKNKVIDEYLGFEYPELSFANLLYYKLDRRQHIKIIRDGLTNGTVRKMIEIPYKNSLFDFDFSTESNYKRINNFDSLIEFVKQFDNESGEVLDCIHSTLAFKNFLEFFTEYYDEKDLSMKEKIKLEKLKSEIQKMFFSIALEDKSVNNRRRELKKLKNFLKELNLEIIPKNMKDYVFIEKEDMEKKT